MARINNNNFLVWEGQFNAAPFDVIATNDAVNMVVNEASKVINVLANDIATYGIDKPSLEITLQDNPGHLAEYNPVSGEITYYPPASVAVGQVRQLKYRWYDNAGHVSNTATVNITITERPIAWRGYAPSYQCEKDGDDNNTGIAFYATLEKYYMDDNTTYIPQTLKPNNVGDPDYIAPAENLAACPLPASTIPLYTWNYTPAPPSIIMNDVIFKNGGSVVASYPVGNSGSPAFQPAQIQVPPDTLYDELVIRMTIINASYAGAYNVTWAPGAGGLGGDVQPVVFPAASGSIQTVTFANIKTGTVFGGDITLQ